MNKTLNAIVTGGGAGIGKSVCQHLLDQAFVAKQVSTRNRVMADAGIQPE